jgi:hypothetical protein
VISDFGLLISDCGLLIYSKFLIYDAEVKFN